MAYQDANGHPTSVTEARAARFANVILETVARYESRWKVSVAPAILVIEPDAVTYVACGLPNGGGCWAPGRLWVAGGAYDELPDLEHEIHHHMLYVRTGDGDIRHAGESWKTWAY